MQENCELLRHCLILENIDHKAPSSTFIQDKQHLESVLGQSQDSWFESLTTRQIQCQKSCSVRPKGSVFDSPSCSPTVSQMLRGHLSVGSSPSVLRHSSPAPYCEREESFNARLSLGTPQSEGWERPLPCLSPGPSPIVENKSILSHPSSSGVYSLGLDDSNMSWTNSLATPPRDPDQMDLLINGTDSSSTKTKETARALFSPGNRQDTSADSVLPLDSTFEEDQSDLDGSDFSQKNVIQSNKNGSQTEVIEQIDNLKIKFNKRLTSRKDSLTGSSKKLRSKHGSNFCDLDENDSTKKTKSHEDGVTDCISGTDSQDFSSSPTFSQKSKCSKVKSCKPRNPPSHNERSFIEDVLSDFFDPPAASVGKRKPAPSRKRKSLEMEDTVISDVKSTAEDLCERSGSTLGISTPKGSLHPILASDKKTRSSSNKKVRFSDNVQKCTFIPEHDTFFAKRAHKKSVRKKMLNTKEKTFSQLENSPCEESFKNENYAKVKENAGEIENEKSLKKCKNSKVRSDPKLENYNGSNQTNGDTTHKCSKNGYQNNKRQSNEFVKNKAYTNQINVAENQEVNIAVGQDKETDKEMEGPSVRGVSEENSEELFSQVSPSALKEMCNVAEKPVTSEEIRGKDVTVKVANSDTGEKLQKPVKVKLFLYPSVSHISNATSTKVFQFREDERKELNKKVLLSSIKLEDVVDKELNMPIDSMKQTQSKEVEKKLPEHEDNVTDNKVKDKQDSEMQEIMMDNVSTKSSHLQIGSSANSMEVLEELSDTLFRSEIGFQSAAGKPFPMSDPALEKATTLLQEDNSHTSPALESLCIRAKDPEHLHHSVAVPTSMEKSDIKDKPQIELLTELMDSDGHSPQGFKSASGKDVHISTKALVKASAIFNEDLPDTKSGFNCISSSESIKTGALTQSVGKGAKTDAEYKAVTLSSIPPQTLEKEKHVFHREKLKKGIIQNLVQSNIISLPDSVSEMCNGFQFASGKEIQLPEMALEKAASLLQEKNTEYTPLTDSKIKNKTDVKAEYGIEDAFSEDIEFSEWCEEDMEPVENLQIDPIFNKTMNGSEMSEQQKENILKRNKLALDDSASMAVANGETKIDAGTKKVTQTEEIDVNKEVLMTSEITDQNPELGKVYLEKSVNNSDGTAVNKLHGTAEKDKKLKASFPAQAQESVKIDKMEDSDSKASFKEENCFQSKQTITCSDSNFVGFKTAGGRSLAFSAEKLKHAEKLLNDTETAVTKNGNIQIDNDKNTLIVRKPKNAEDEDKRGNEVRFRKEILGTELPDVNRQSEDTLILGRDSEDKNDTFTIQSSGIQNSVREFNKKTVAERLISEFENDMIVNRNQNNDLKCVENELKYLADFKTSRMEQKENVKFLSAPAESSKNIPVVRNVPKGFRPFKPPKITKISSHKKYPKSVVNDVECTKQSYTESVKSDRLNQKTSTNDISVKTTMKKNILYPESKLKVWEQGKGSSENKHVTQNDNFKSTNKSITEGNNQVTNPFAGSDTINKHDNDKTDVSNVDLEGMSQMFEDDMDFTQTADFGMNECIETQNAAKDKKEDSKTTKKDKENTLKDRVLESESKPNKEDINCSEGFSSKESNCFGFSSASGISVSVSTSALESAVKMLSECDEGIKTQDSKQRDLNNDRDRSDVKEEKQGNKITCINNTCPEKGIEQSENVLKGVKKSDDSSVQDSTDTETTKSGPTLCQFDNLDGNSSNSNTSSSTMVNNCVVPECTVDNSKSASSEKLEPVHQSVESLNGNILSKYSKNCSIPVSFGFNTASGKKIEVSEAALKHAESTMVDLEDISEKNKSSCSSTVVRYKDLSEVDLLDNPESVEAIFTDFRTNSGGIVEVYENESKHAKENMSEMNCYNKIKFEGFSTASGKNVQVSKEALKHAKACLSESKDLQPETKFQGFTTVSEKALEHEKDSFATSNLYKSPESETRFQGFSTASGKTVQISEKALKHAKESSVETLNSYESPEPEAKFHGFSTASGKTVQISEKALKHAKESLMETSNSFESLEPAAKFHGFSTASGKTVQISEKAFKHAKKSLMENSNSYESLEPEAKFHGFSTASGNTVHVSEKAFEHTKESLVETSNSNKWPEHEAKLHGFTTASGKTVQISEKALKHAMESLVETSNSYKNPETEAKFHGFRTVSWNTVHVSEKALEHTKESLVETSNSNKIPGPEAKFHGFSTASGKTVKVSEKALKHAKESFVETSNFYKNPEHETKFQGFSTASGKKVTISEKALKHAKESLEETAYLYESPESETKFQGFSTASGKTVTVSEKALKHAKESLVGTTNSYENPEPEAKFHGFSTASGKSVAISEKALKYAKESFVETTNFYENQEPVTNFNGFKNASGNKEKVLKEALEKVNDHQSLSETTGIPGFDPEFAGFSTALGNKVEVSEKALIYVKKNFCEKDSLNRDQKAETRFSGFCTASGKTVEVSETALKLATDSLNKNPEGVDSLNQFDKNQTAVYSETITQLRQGNQMEQIQVGNSETEIRDTDFEEMFGMALKRRKLDMNRERRMVQNMKDEDSCKRKAVKNTPKGNTDQRHPGFRPFKPVFCKALDKHKQLGRQDVSAVSQCSNIIKNVRSTTPLLPSYKTSSENPTVLSSCVISSKQEMMVKTQACTSGSVSNQGQGDGGDTKSGMKPFKTCMLPSGDCKQKSECGLNVGIQTQHTSVKSDLPKTASGEMIEVEKKANQLGIKIDTETSVNIQDGTPERESDFSKENNASVIEEKVKSDGLDTTQASDHGDFDSFSQDEDDVYYCMLVEARRHQDNIIKQRGSNRVRPVAGRLWKMKRTQNRWKLRDLIDNLGQEQHRSDIAVTSGNAINHRFLLESHYSKNTAHVVVGDGAYLVPDDIGKVGKQEFYRAFLTMEEIDGSLVSEAWVYNHYRWIVWKLAAYEKTSSCLHSRCLTPEMVMLQLKYRYDREVDLSQRSALKKIYERDDTPSKRLVLCVAAVKRHNQDGSTVDQSKTVLDERVILELTDGWYSIPAQVDPPLTQLVLRGKIKVGHKLCVTGAELVGGEDACTPLEAPSSVMLRICRNSTRPAPWDSVLGYQNDPRPLCVPLSDIHCDGGIVGVVDVVIVRKYPTMFMEKFEGGGCIFRTGRCEDRARQEYEVKKQTEMEKLYRQMENVVEKEQKQEKKIRQRKKFSRTEIEELQSGMDIFEAMEEAAQPDMVQNYLSEHQMSMLYEYQQQLQEQKQFELNSRFQKAWQEKLEVFQERSVTPVLKFRVAGCANSDLDQNTSTILTLWRPAPEIAELQEGHRYKIYSLSSSPSRSKYIGRIVQLTATKQTRFRRMQLDENILDTVYEPREVLWVVDIKRRQPPYGELDFVGMIVKITQSSVSDRMCDTVYLADCQTGILAIRFWNGYKTFGEDLFVMGSVLCCSNLMDKSSYRGLRIPTVEVSSEFTHITNKSQNTAQRKVVDKLLSVAKDKKVFMEKASAVLDQLLNENINQNIPKKILGITNEFIKEFPRSNVGKQSFKISQTGTDSIYSAADMEMDNSVLGDENQKLENVPIDNRSAYKSSVDFVCEKKGAISVPGEAEIPQMDKHMSVLDPADVCTPVMERKRSVAQAKMARLLTYGSPSLLSPLSTAVPRSVTKGFKPPAFKKL